MPTDPRRVGPPRHGARRRARRRPEPIPVVARTVPSAQGRVEKVRRVRPAALWSFIGRLPMWSVPLIRCTRTSGSSGRSSPVTASWCTRAPSPRQYSHALFVSMIFGTPPRIRCRASSEAESYGGPYSGISGEKARLDIPPVELTASRAGDVGEDPVEHLLALLLDVQPFEEELAQDPAHLETPLAKTNPWSGGGARRNPGSRAGPGRRPARTTSGTQLVPVVRLEPAVERDRGRRGEPPLRARDELGSARAARPHPQRGLRV